MPADDALLSSDVDVDGLLRACVRITREVAPLQTTLVVLDHDLIKALTQAGLPLERLVAPCPDASGAPAGTAGQALRTSAGGPGDRQASAVPALADRLSFTGASPWPLAWLAAGLLGLGLVLGRRARVAARAVRPVRGSRPSLG